MFAKTRQGRKVRECDQHEISTYVFHSFAILSRSTWCSSLLRSPFEAIDEALFFGVAAALREPTVSSPDTIMLSRLTSSEARPPLSGYSFVRYFSSGTLARQSYSPLRPLVPFPSIWSALYRDSSTAVFLCLRFRTPSRQIGKCAPRREFTKSPEYTLSRFYTAGQANFRDRTMSRIPVERSLRFIGPILETFCSPVDFLSNLYTVIKKRIYFLDQSLSLDSENFVRGLLCERTRICIRSRCALDCRGAFQCTFYKKWAILLRDFSSASLYGREIFRSDKTPSDE